MLMLAFYAAEKAAYDTMGKGLDSTTLDLVLLAVLSLIWVFQARDKGANEEGETLTQGGDWSGDQGPEEIDFLGVNAQQQDEGGHGIYAGVRSADGATSPGVSSTPPQ